MKVITDMVDGIKARQMAIHLPTSSNDTAAPLFKLEAGVASSSAGLICAKKAGLDAQIISRANEIITNMRQRRKLDSMKTTIAEELELEDRQIKILELFFANACWEKATDDQIRSLMKNVARAAPDL